MVVRSNHAVGMICNDRNSLLLSSTGDWGRCKPSAGQGQSPGWGAEAKLLEALRPYNLRHQKEVQNLTVLVDFFPSVSVGLMKFYKNAQF